MKFLKPGKVVIVLQGRYAGRKAVIVRTSEEGEGKRKYGFAVVAGIDKYPLRVTRGMSQKKIARRSRVQPFVKAINLNHLMPTRYNLEQLDVKAAVPSNALSTASGRRRVRVAIKSTLESRYKTGKNRWFFQKLRF